MESFHAAFGRAPAVEARANGRVNLIGEHTDYNGGFVLPTAIPQGTWVGLTPRPGGTVRVMTASHPGETLEYTLGGERPTGSWGDYVQGVTRVLGSRGYRLGGFDAAVESDLPMGSGLSSSAALDVALMRALREAFSLSFDDVELARLGQAVENEFVGARVGILDPMAISLADPGTALFLDTRSLAFERIPLPLHRGELVVIHSGVSHRNASGGYNTRRSECEEAARRLGVTLLREVTPADLPRLMSLPDPLSRRVRHVVTENARVLAAVEALRRADMGRLGKLFLESHASLRDDYEVSVPEIDFLVDSLVREPGVFGARMTGGGFGGSLLAMAEPGKGRAAAERVCEAYRRHFSAVPAVLVPPRR